MNQIYIFEKKFVNIMKQLFFLLAFLPLFVVAQDDAKYLKGAVPVENGKVVFRKVINLPSFSKDKIYNTSLSWAKERFNDENCRVVFENSQEGELAAVGNEYIVFASTILSLDRAHMNYQVLIFSEDNSCKIEVKNIRYLYDVAYQREPEKYIAEEWITDEHGLHKGKLSRISGKFRKATIDFVDKLFTDLSNAFGQQAMNNQSAVTTNENINAVAIKEEPATKPAPISNIQQTTAVPNGFTKIEIAQIPNMMKQLLAKSDVRIKVADKDLTDDALIWKGFSSLFGKNIASISVDANSAFCKDVKEGETYTIQFSEKPYAQESVWMMIECKKQGNTPDGNNQTVIGEVLNIWVK